MTNKPEAYNTNEDKYGWDDVPLDPHYVYDKERMDKYLAEQNELIRKLRYNMLKWKAAAILKEGRHLTYHWECDAQCKRIVKALERRAAKILEGK